MERRPSCRRITVTLEVGVVLIRKRHSLCLLQLKLVPLHLLHVDSDLRRCKGDGGGELKGGVAGELACEPDEWLLEVVVGLGRDLEVLEVL